MKIAVTAMGDTMEDQVAFRMGRNAYYLIIDTDTLDVEPIENPDRVNNVEISVPCALLMQKRGVRAVITGHCGPEAHKVFGDAGIVVLPGINGDVADVVTDFRKSPEMFGFSEAETPPAAPVGRKARRSVAFEEFLQMKAEMVVMQRKLLDLQRRVKALEGR